VRNAEGVHVCALSIDLHIPASGSLKSKRMVIRPILDGARVRFHVAAAEVAFQEQWQRSRLGFAAVACAPGQVGEVLDKLERFVWSHPEIDVISADRQWLDTDE
jgi:uncharacterized protein YlxP (DUF503 family)